MSLIAQALPVATATQNAGGKRTYGLDVSALSVQPWQANASIPANALIRPTQKNQTGLIYQAGSGGQSGSVEPNWFIAIAAGAVVIDGSLSLTARVPPVAGQDQIASVAWTQMNPPDGALTIGAQANTTLVASAEIGGGTIGSTYTVLITVTMTSGQIWPQIIYITIQ